MIDDVTQWRRQHANTARSFPGQ